MDDIRVGIIGFGRIGAEHAERLSCAKAVRAVATADVTEARRAMARTRGLRAVETVEQLLGDRAIDAVLISTPTSMHFQQAIQALAAGKHVMIEKPMALDLIEARKLVDEARRCGRALSVFHNRRWDLDYLTVKAAMDAGVFGKVINIESRLGQFASCVGPAAKEYRPGWRNEAAFGGGGLFDWGSHFVDQLLQMMRPALAVLVFAQLRGNIWSRDCDDFARVCIDFDNGAAGMVEINTTTMNPLPRWHVDGTLATATSPHSLEFDVAKWAEVELTPVAGRSRRLELAPSGLNEIQIWEQFAAAIRGEGEPAVTAESVLPTMTVLDAARQSGATGKAIEL